LRVQAARDLFTAPNIDPLSNESYAVVGEPARLLRRLITRGDRRWPVWIA
jgi:hypothetical protein